MAARIIVELTIGLIKALPELIKNVPKIIMAIVDGLADCYEDLKDAGKDIVSGLWQGIKDNWDDLKSSVKDAASDLVDGIKDFFKIGSPSKLFRDEVGKWIPEGIAVGIEGNTDSITNAMDDLTNETLVAGNQLIPSSFAFDQNYNGSVLRESDDTMNAILTMLQKYMPYYATNDRLNNLNFNVNNVPTHV